MRTQQKQPFHCGPVHPFPIQINLPRECRSRRPLPRFRHEAGVSVCHFAAPRFPPLPPSFSDAPNAHHASRSCGGSSSRGSIRGCWTLHHHHSAPGRRATTGRYRVGQPRRARTHNGVAAAAAAMHMKTEAPGPIKTLPLPPLQPPVLRYSCCCRRCCCP